MEGKKMVTVGSCRKCEFWEDYDMQAGHALFGRGVCRRHSPRREWANWAGEGQEVLWPTTKREDWCGDFRKAQTDDNF